MHDEAPHGPFHPDGQLQQPLTQGGDLCGGTHGALGVPPQFLEQPIRGGSEQDPKLIGPEPRATRPVQGEPLMQFFEPMLHIAPLAVVRIHHGGWGTEIGHHEAGIAFGLAAWQPDNRGLDDHATPMRPTPGGVQGLAEDVLGVATVFGQTIGLSHEPPGAPHQSGVAGQSNHILHPLSLQEVQPVVTSEAAIHADSERGARARPTQVLQQDAQESTGPVFRGTVAGPQHNRHQILVGFVVEGQRGYQGQVTPGVIVSIEAGERLLPMGGIVGRVQIDRDTLRPPLQTLPMVS